MPASRVFSRLPRAGIDPIDDPATVARILSTVIHRPLRDETLVVLVDAERRGIGLVVVTGTSDPDAVIEVVECLAAPTAHGGRIAGMIVASVRPGWRTGPTLERSDVERWMELSTVADDRGVEVIEWFVIGPDDVTCPRDRLGEPPRW
jgi:hypothetical protein